MNDHEGTDIAEPEMRRARWGREGYRAPEVDEALTQIRAALRVRPPTMAPYEVADRRFKVSRSGRRYDLRRVDDYLDQAQEALREGHGDDPVARRTASLPPPHHVRTGWIYALALVLVLAMLAFMLTQY